MLEESQRGHLKFWLSEVVVVVEEEEGDGLGDGEEEIFLSPAIRPEPPNSSWIIFSSL